MKENQRLQIVCFWLVVLLALFGEVVIRQGRVKAARQDSSTESASVQAPAASPTPGTPGTKRVKFSLSTTRAYGTNEPARFYVNYLGVETLDFRVYRVDNPFLFFRQLENPHVMGEEEYAEVSDVSTRVGRQPSALERVRAFKRRIYQRIKSYIRGQLTRKSRTAFNDRFMTGEQRPLFEADFARMPLLNPDQMVRSWRQVLTPMANEYDTRMITLGKRDAGVYLVEAVSGDLRAYTIAVVTDLTVVQKTTSDGHLLVYAVDRQSGEPRGSVNIEVVRRGKVLASGTTNVEGVFRATVERDLPPAKPPVAREDFDPAAMAEEQNSDYLILAGRGWHFAASDLSAYSFRWNNLYASEGGADDMASYVYTERPVYRPGQKVFFKGIVRRIAEEGYEIPLARIVPVIVRGADDKELSRQDLTMTMRGTFSGEFEIPANAPLGNYRIIPLINNAPAGEGSFQVAEYKKPEYKVTVATPRKFVPVGEKATFTVEAKYFFGEPVRQAQVKYYIYRSRYYHWWGEREDDGLGASGEADEGAEDLYGYGNDMVLEGEGRLDAAGRLTVPFEVPMSENEVWDYTYRLEAQVTDASRREISGQASFVGTRGRLVVTASPDRYVYFQGDTANITVKAADYEGRPQAAKVRLVFSEIRYEQVEKEEDGYKYIEYKPLRRELSSTEVTTNAQGEGAGKYRVPIVGYIRIEAIFEEGGRRIPSLGGYLYSTDRNNGWADMASRDSGSIRLVADKAAYQPGDVARVLAILPHDNVHLLVTTEMNRILSVRHVYAQGRVAVIDLPIEERHVPNVYLSVTYVRGGEMFEQSRSLAVPARAKFLRLDLIPDKRQYKPREPASWTVLARDADGKPAAGVEVSLGVVDESIYSIAADNSGDIRRGFYGTRYNGVSTGFSSSFTFTGYSGKKEMQLTQNRRARQLADFKNESQYAEVTIRKEFRDTAFWAPEVVTGPDGRATAKMILPDNLTTWRATARAVTADLRVGSRIDRVLSRKDLILRLETPRFMTEGDVVTVSGIVHNYLPTEKVAQIELKVSGATLLNDSRQTVTIGSQGEQRIDWRIEASQVGSATLTATARTDVESDGVELPLPVVPLGLKETRAEAAALTGESVEKSWTLDLPGNASPQLRSLRLEASPSIAGALFGGLDYLTSYPYGCTEQTLSSFVPNVIVARTLKEVKSASLRQDNDLPRKVQRGFDRLYELQHSDGGWGWWKDDKTDPLMTAYAIDGLTLAARSGFEVQTYRLEIARDRLKVILDSGRTADDKPIDPDSRAYLVYVMANSGKVGQGLLDDLYARRRDLQSYGLALLALALDAAGDKRRAGEVAAEVEQGARTTEYDAHWEATLRPLPSYSEQADTEATVHALRALARLRPGSPLLPKAARWLVANRQNGYYWESTKQTAFAILGLTDYLRVSRELSADYSFEVYLDGEQVLSRRVTAAEAVGGQALVVERSGTGLGGSSRIRVVKRGAGTLYFSAALEYYRREESVAPRASSNLTLTREYLRLKVSEVNGKPTWALEPLTGEVRSGDLLVSRLRLQGSRARYVMIEDPLPAGCEQVEQVSGIELGSVDGRWSDWYNQREFRDLRTVYFLDYFDGNTTFQTAMRVQVPGSFKVSPARAELMYQPAVQSNTGSVNFRFSDRQ